MPSSVHAEEAPQRQVWQSLNVWTQQTAALLVKLDADPGALPLVHALTLTIQGAAPVPPLSLQGGDFPVRRWVFWGAEI